MEQSCQILCGLIQVRIESEGLCQYAQIHANLALVNWSVATCTLVLMAATERWPAVGIATVTLCTLLGIGPEAILALCLMFSCKAYRKHRQLQIIPQEKEENNTAEAGCDAETGGHNDESETADTNIPSAGFKLPIGILLHSGSDL